MAAMATTVRAAIQRAQNRLRSTYKRNIAALSAAVTTTTVTTITVDDATHIAAGQLLCINLEIMHVRSVSSTTITVRRGQLGTTATTHLIDTIIEVRYSHAMAGLLHQHLEDEIRSWPPDIFRVQTLTSLTTSSGVRGYSTGLTYDTEAFGILSASVAPSTGDTSLDWSPVGFKLVRNPASAMSADGMGIILDWTPDSARGLQIEYSAPFTLSTFAIDTDLVATVGLRQSQLEVAWLGAAYRALSEVPAVDTSNQVESRNKDEVQPGQITGVRQDLEREYQKRKQTEIARLIASYPPRQFR